MKYEKIHRFHTHEDDGRYQQMYHMYSRDTFIACCKVRYIVRGFLGLAPYKVKRLLHSRWKDVSWNWEYYE